MADKPERNNRYHDLLFRIIIAVAAAHVIVVFGEKDSIFQLLLTWDYWRSLLFSFAIALSLISLVYAATAFLDRRFDWAANTTVRAALQLLLGVGIPGIAAFLMAAIYFRIYDIDIFVTRYLQYDFPVVLLMLLIVNLYYLAFYFFLQWKNGNKKAETSENTKEVFLVSQGAKIIPLSLRSIVYFYRDGDYNFVRTTNNEDYVINETLDEVLQQLPPKFYFRVNRQFIVNIEACVRFDLLTYGKLELFVEPTFKTQLVISQKRSKAFKDWISRELK